MSKVIPMTSSDPTRVVMPPNFIAKSLGWVWRDRWTGTAIAIGVAVLSGLTIAFTMPRGPTNSAQALIVMASGLVIGLVAGVAMRSRWAMLLAPLMHVIAIEL